jgi:hypothetical protein
VVWSAGAASTPPLGRFALSGSGARSTIVCGAYKLVRRRPHPLLQDLPEVVHLPAAPGRNPGLRAMVDLLGAELHEAPPGAAAVARSLVDALLVYLLRAWMSGSEETTTSWSAALTDPGMSCVLAGGHARRPPPGVDGGAARRGRRALACGVRPPVRLRRGRTAADVPHALADDNRAQLLRTTDKTLAQVASAIGYGSPFAFAKAFQREYATTPGGYRADAAG